MGPRWSSPKELVRPVATTLAAVAAVAGALVALPASAGQVPDPLAAYRARAGVPLTVHRDAHGRVDFVGSQAAGVIPLGARIARGLAAREQLDRLGDVLGTEGADLRARSTSRSVDGGSVTRYQQYVDGLPVLGGETVVGLDGHGGLSSAATRLSDAVAPARGVVGRAQAIVAARRVVARAHPGVRGLTVSDEGAWLYDDTLVSGPAVGTARVYRLTVGNRADVRETVLVDAATGRVLLHVDETPEINRRVCDLQNTRWTGSGQLTCTDASYWLARSEGGAASSVADVNQAYDLIGSVSDFYASLGIDLTDLIGDGASKGISATVRYCNDGSATPPSPCPLDNAFWNGTQIYIGASYAADDVIAHELTHGVIEHTSDLFYYQESGALNESLADVMGEIFDHQHVSSGDVPGQWTIGEDLPGGPFRSMSDPTAYGQPDRMTSPDWDADETAGAMYADNGGVHTNSGVGNKTAYLIGHGGTFNGRTVTGIDASDPTSLTKTAALYTYVIEHLVSGSQYADLGRVLVQGCQALVASSTAGFTSSDCTEVSAATAATELSSSPAVAGATRPADASSACPTGTRKRALATPSISTGSSGIWAVSPGSGVPDNSRDGDGSYYGFDPDPSYGDPVSGSLTTGTVVVPAGQRTYLWFSQWYQFEWYQDSSGPEHWDGGQVTVQSGSTSEEPPASSWVNGPDQALILDDPDHRVRGFGGDSNGWNASRVDLSAYQGKSVSIDWTSRGDSTSGSYYGWFVDEVSFYTCDPQPLTNTAAPKITGTPRVGVKLTATDGSWSPTATSVTYQWLRSGAAIAGATRSAYTAVAADHGKRLSVKVTAANGAWKPTASTSAQTAAVALGTITAAKPKITGTTKVGRTLTATAGTWKPSGLRVAYQWLRNGAAIKGATRKTYALVKADRGKRISVRVTCSKAGYASKAATSAQTAVVK